MSRPIDAEKLKTKYAWWRNGDKDAQEWKEVFDFMIDNAPTLEPEEGTERVVYCSECTHGHVISSQDGPAFRCDQLCQIFTPADFCSRGVQRQEDRP